jgi:hypothetical protein
MATRSYRNTWIRTIAANFVGIVVLLIGWATNSGALLLVGLGILVVSFGYRLTAQVNAPSSRHR